MFQLKIIYQQISFKPPINIIFYVYFFYTYEVGWLFYISNISSAPGIIGGKKSIPKEYIKDFLQRQVSWLTPVIPDLGSRITNIRSLRPSSATW